MSALEAAKSFQQLQARRDAQATLFRDLNVYQSTYSAVRTSLEETSDPGNEQSLQQQQEKLREAYQTAYAHAAEEARLHHECLAHVKALLRKRDRNAMQADDYGAADHAVNPYAHDPLYIWHHDSSRTLPIGSEVAALVDAHSQPPLWIQCVIKAYRAGSVSGKERVGERLLLRIHFLSLHAHFPASLFSSSRRQRPKYECLDLDTGENPSSPVDGEPAAPVRRKAYWLDERKVLPLPTLQEIPMERRREFAKGERVIAVFPTSGITTLYPAVVVAPPSKRGKSGGGGPSYSLMFDDDEENTRTVSAQFVAPLIELPAEDDD